MITEEFIEDVKSEIQKKVEGTVTVNEVTKNNGLKFRGLTVFKDSVNISPTIYLDVFYEEYLKGMNMHEIINEIVEILKKNEVKENMNISFFTDFERVKNKIVCKLINFNANHELLEKIPYKRFLDMAVVYYMPITDKNIGKATILIHNNHLDMWNITLEELDLLARKNNETVLGSEIRSMSEIMHLIMRENILKEFEDTMGENFSLNDSMENTMELLTEQMIGNSEEFKMPMFVAGNRTRTNGASVILDKHFLKNVGEMLDGDFYILPSSIHEGATRFAA